MLMFVQSFAFSFSRISVKTVLSRSPPLSSSSSCMGKSNQGGGKREVVSG